MDVYSFGMLCFWLLFRTEYAATAGCHQETNLDNEELMDFKDPLEELEFLERLKMAVDYKLLQWATSLAMAQNCVNADMNHNLVQLLNLTLAFKPEDRTADFEHLLSLLAPTR
jgi:hypothetical protein